LRPNKLRIYNLHALLSAAASGTEEMCYGCQRRVQSSNNFHGRCV